MNRILRSITAAAALATTVLASSAACALTIMTNVHDFGGSGDGSQPLAGLEWRAASLTLWGTTCTGGGSGLGTVYQFKPTNPSGTYQVVHSFVGTDGDCPAGDLLHGGGILRGTTEYGGSSNDGTVFRVSPSGFTSLYSFLGGTDGAYPLDQLLRCCNGGFAGTTSRGGSPGIGTVFYVLGTSETQMHVFPDTMGEGDPVTGLTKQSPTLFYGTTMKGGGCGAVFSIQKTSPYTVSYLHYFNGATEGCHPASKLRRVGGVWYGTLQDGGSSLGCGSFFRMTPAGTITGVYSFACGPGDGENPSGDLAYVSSTNMFYGTTENGGASGNGMVFSIDPTTLVETVLYNFSGPDGAAPKSGMRELPLGSGKMYGTTSGGGANSVGTVFCVSTTTC